MMRVSQRHTWVFWSTRESAAAEIPSITAIVETLLVVPTFIWLGIQFDHFRLYILLSATFAPLVLLRSPQSEETGLRWFLAFERNFNRWFDPSKRLFGIYLVVIHDALTMILLQVIPGALVLFLLTLPESPFNRPEQAQPTFPEFVFGKYWLCFISVLFAIVKSNIWALRHERQYTLYILTLCGTSVVMILLLILLGSAYPGAILPLVTIGTTLLFLLFFGMVFALLVTLWVIRMGSNITHLISGIECIPENFRRLTLCTSPLHEPELIPGLSRHSPRYSLKQLNRLYLAEPQGDWTDFFSGRKLFGFLIVLLFAPSWLYRLTLKSTAWLWWPLSFLSKPPSLAANPDWFHARVTQTRWARHSRFLAYLSILLFLIAGIWRFFQGTEFPSNPFLNIIGYAFVIDWSTTPWQLLGFGGAIISLGIVYLVDWSYQKYQIGKQTNDVALANHALQELTYIERLSRLRTMVFLAYCALVGLQGFLVLNSRGCWMELSPRTLSWFYAIYGSSTPGSGCPSRTFGSFPIINALL